MAAEGNNNIRRIIHGIYNGNEIPVIRRLNILYGVREVEVILPDVAHVKVARSITVIPEQRFFAHPNLVELICHENVAKIESDDEAETFLGCPRLRRVVMNGMEEVERHTFYD